jgi:membrane protease subunit HflK
MANDNPIKPENPPTARASAEGPLPAPAKSMAVEDAGAVALDEALRTSFRMIKFLMVLLVMVFIFSGIFIVAPNQVAIRLHFGRPVGVGTDQLLLPGLHWALPYPIDEIVRVPMGQSHTLVSRVGWYAVTPEQERAKEIPAAQPFLQAGVDGYTLTGDGNIIHAKATLKYRLQPNGVLNYTFLFENVTNLLQNLLDNALIYASARVSAESALYLDTSAFRDLVAERFQRHLADRQVGVQIESLGVDPIAPLAVQPAFDNVTSAQQAASTNLHQAEIYAGSATNNAFALASAMVNEGLARSNELVKTVESDASSFTRLLPAYQRDSTLFRQRMLTETMQRVLTNAQDKFFVPARADGQLRELRLQLSREPAKKRGDQPK